MHQERQARQLRRRVGTLRQRVQPDFIEAQHARQPAKLGLGQLRAVIDGVLNARQFHAARLGQVFHREGGMPGRFLQHIPEFVFKRWFVEGGDHGRR